MNQLTSGAWWKAAGIRALRSGLVIAVAYVPASLSMEVPYVTIALAFALAIVVSFLTSLTGLPELSDEGEPWWKAVIERVVKSIAQGAIVGVGAAVLITDVDWASVGTMALTAGFGSLLLAVLSSLPEDNGTNGQTVNNSTIINTTESVEVITDSIPVIGDDAITTGSLGAVPIRAEHLSIGQIDASKIGAGSPTISKIPVSQTDVPEGDQADYIDNRDLLEDLDIPEPPKDR